MKTEIIIDKKMAEGTFVKVTKFIYGFPEPPEYKVETETGVKLEFGSAEEALRVLAKYC
jgi:hypothetical protein